MGPALRIDVSGRAPARIRRRGRGGGGEGGGVERGEQVSGDGGVFGGSLGTLFVSKDRCCALHG